MYMYDPRLPNNYADESLRAKPPASPVSASPAAVTDGTGNDPPASFDAGARAAREIIGEPSQGGSAVTPEELRRQRVALSAKMGVGAALELERDEHAAAMHERSVGGTDVRSKARALLAKRAAAAGNTDGPGAGLSGLTLEKSELGGHQIVAQSAPKKAPVKGKPSTCLLLRNVHGGYDLPEAASDVLLMDMQSECAKHGVVKATRVHTIELQPGWLPTERVRVLVRFDNRVAAFKAATALQGRLYDGRELVISFFPLPQFERGELGPTDDEERLTG